MPRAAAMLLLAALPACGMIGHATQRSVEAAGVAMVSVVGTPVMGFVSWPLWNYLGGHAATWVSGTQEVRVAASSGHGEQSGDQPSRGLRDALDDANPLTGWKEDFDLLTWIAAIALFFALGGPAWVARKLAKARKEDDAWADSLTQRRAAHEARTASLEARMDRLERSRKSSRSRPHKAPPAR